MNSAEQPDEAQRVVEAREVPRVGKTSSAAARNEPMGRPRVLDRDDRIAIAPDDQERDGLRQVEAIARVHPLAPGVDDRS